MRRSRMMVMAWVASGLVWSSAFAGDRTAGVVERPAKASVVSVRLASEVASPGMDKVVTDNGQVLYVSKEPVLTGADLLSATSGADGHSVALKVSQGKEAAIVGRVAIFVDGNFVGAPHTSKNADNSIALIGLDPQQAARVSRSIVTRPVDPTSAQIVLVPQQPGPIEPGGTIIVDAFIDSAVDLRAYQVAVEITGGTAGQVAIKDMLVDNARPDWVFAGQQAVNAANRVGGRMMGALYSGGINVAERKYAGTIVLEASADAFGSFTIKLREDHQQTTMKNPDNISIAFAASLPQTIVVGNRPVRGQK